jgi:CDP-diacylglycerol--glycerol-3-phosphate 3-phosphatidyltransferase
MANFITLFRLPLLTIFVVLLDVGNETVRLWCITILVVLLLMDTLDGFIARSLKQVSLLGSVLDIAVDRTVELVLWVVYCHFRLIPVIVPLIIIARGVTVDAVRAVRLKGGVMPFQQVRARLSQFLVASPFMRSLYGITKGLAFIVLTLDLGLRTSNPPAWEPLVHTIAMVLTWLAVSACLARGLPVLIEGFRYLKSQDFYTSE